MFPVKHLVFDNKIILMRGVFDYRAKEEAKKQQEKAETEAKQRLENEKAESEAKKEAYRRQVEASLPAEPIVGQGDVITKIRFRLPKGENIERKFQADTPLKVSFWSKNDHHLSFQLFYFHF